VRIFLDANILFSAAKSTGAVRQLLAMLLEQGHELRADGYVVEEARRNLALKSPASMPELESLLSRIELAPVASQAVSTLPLPEKDRPVLEAAIRSRSDMLVTGDRTHFGRFFGSKVEGVEILSPAMLAERVLR
jgi:uncharacterized protein